jgi:long-chain acyl-CoA synthetase
MEKPWLAHYESAVPPTLTYPAITLSQTLEDSARKFPDHCAARLVLRYVGDNSLGASLTYRELAAEVDHFAAALYALGVRKGDRVALMLPNLPQFVIAFFGILKLGAIVVNTNPQYTSREIEHQFADSGAETAVMLSPFYSRLQEVQERTAIKRVILTDLPDYVPSPAREAVAAALQKDGMIVPVPESGAADGVGVYYFRPLLDAHPEPPPSVDVGPDDVALFQYTGGTTGVPKAAMLTHYNLVANTVQIRRWIYDIEDGANRTMGAIPFYHVYGMTVAVLLSIYTAGELIIIANPRPIDVVMEAIDREKPTLYPGVPSMYVGIINHPNVARYDLRSVRACLSGSAPLPMDVQIKFGEITGGRLVEGYGLTEAAPVTHVNPIYGERRAGAIGLPVSDVEAKIVNFETLEDALAGEQGELWVRGPQVMIGYWNQPEETAKTIMKDGWLRTGDIARMDADGYFYIVDRLKDIIIASGYNIVPREVEEVLYEYPKVQEAVVAGIPDRYRGETVKAFIVLKAGQTATAEEIITFCRTKLAPFKVPTQVEFRSELPKTMVGKMLRRVLVEEEKKKQQA